MALFVCVFHGVTVLLMYADVVQHCQCTLTSSPHRSSRSRGSRRRYEAMHAAEVLSAMLLLMRSLGILTGRLQSYGLSCSFP